jgi:hypothetical protein
MISMDEAPHMADVTLPNQRHRPQPGDVVICDVEESEEPNQSYWVRTQSRDSAASLFEGPDAWARARAAADERVGETGAIWRLYKDGRFERV